MRCVLAIALAKLNETDEYALSVRNKVLIMMSGFDISSYFCLRFMFFFLAADCADVADFTLIFIKGAPQYFSDFWTIFVYVYTY
jgi:hypothetical protein